jgi:protein-tyrosine phosphatase
MTMNDPSGQPARRSFLAAGNPFLQAASGATGGEHRTFDVLVVCTGNICRSAYAALLLGAATRRDDDLIRVSSAGIGAVVGAPMHADEARAATALGLDPSGHRGRQLTAPLIDDADLVLALSERHLEVILTERPSAMDRTFLLGDYAALCALPSLDGQPTATRADLCAQVGYAARLRDAGRQADHGDIAGEIDDPYGHGPARHRVAIARIEHAVGLIAARLQP